MKTAAYNSTIHNSVQSLPNYIGLDIMTIKMKFDLLALGMESELFTNNVHINNVIPEYRLNYAMQCLSSAMADIYLDKFDTKVIYNGKVGNINVTYNQQTYISITFKIV